MAASSGESSEEELVGMLLAATRRGELATVQSLVEGRGVSASARGGDDGWTPLHVATVRRLRDVAAYLLAQGADVNAAAADGTLPLDLATRGSDADGGRWFVDAFVAAARARGVRLQPGGGGAALLVDACVRGDADWARRLLADFHMDCTRPARGGCCAALAAVERGSAELVRLLLDTGDADRIARVTRAADQATLFHATIGRDARDVGELLAYALPPDAHLFAATRAGATALHLAVEAGADEAAALWWVDLVATRAGDGFRPRLLDAQRRDGATAMHLAIAKGRARVAERLLAEGPRLDITRSSDGETALTMACSANPLLLWRMLSEFPVNPRTRRGDGSTPLLLVCEVGDVRAVEKLLELWPAGVDVARSDGITPLHMAIVTGNKHIGQRLLAAGAKIDTAKIGQNETLLHLVLGPSSSSIRNKRFVRRPDWAMLLLERAAPGKTNVDAKRRDGTTPLMLACMHTDMPVVRRLLELGANPNMTTPEGNCALAIGYEKGHQELCRMLLDAGAKLSVPSAKRNNETLLHTVLQRGDQDWIRLFLSKALPEDFVAQRADRSIPLHVACEVEIDKALFEEIVAKTPDINIPRFGGVTALHIAARKGDLFTVRTLLKRGADPRAMAIHNLTPLHFACHAGQAAVAKLLVSVGCDPQQVAGPIDVDEPDGNSVELARRAGNFRLARMLMDPLRSSLAVMLHKVKLDVTAGDADDEASATSAVIFEPIPGPLEEGECSICGETEMLLPLSRCGHKFCRGCLNSWFEAQFNGVQHPRCPNRDCGSIASYYDLHACMEHPEKYDEQALRKALMDIPAFRWCPKCGSGGVAPCGDAVCIQCGFHFCAECMLEAHEGTCAENLNRMLAGERGKLKEARLAHEIQESQRWIEGNTKPCPNCHCSIKKSGGCSHMTCRCCKYQFCWICLGKYQGRYTFDGTCPCQPQQQQQQS